MKTKFRKALHELLIKEDISLESGIVNELIYRMANVKVAAREYDNYLPGFQLEAREWDKKDELQFNLPQLSMKELKKILDLFGMTEEDYKTNSSLVFKNEQFVLETLIPAFTRYFIELKSSDPSFINEYRIKSKPILESSAFNTLKKYSQDAIDLILKDELALNHDGLLNSLVLLRGRMEQLSTHPGIYKKICSSGAYHVFHKKTGNDALDKALEMVTKGISLFNTFNRNKSVLAIKRFQKEMEEFLNQHQVSSDSCDVVENILLAEAGASLGKKGTSTMRVGNDASRMVFIFEDMDASNAKKVIDYLQQLGDVTAMEGRGYKQHGSYIPEAAMHKSMPVGDYSSRTQDEEIEEHGIEMDGEFLYDTLFPHMKKGFAKLTQDEGKLKEFQIQSQKCEKFKKDNTTPAATSNRNVMFQPADGELRAETVALQQAM